LSPYEIAINIVRNELTELTNTTRYPAQVVEVQQIHVALETLEGRLQTLRYFSPKPEQKPGLLDVGGKVLQVLFGVSTMQDLQRITSAVDMLETKQQEVSHSLDHQVTYLKQLDTTVRFDHAALGNLSAIVKDFALKTLDNYCNMVSKVQ
jgi:hypothetical protein